MNRKEKERKKMKEKWEEDQGESEEEGEEAEAISHFDFSRPKTGSPCPHSIDQKISISLIPPSHQVSCILSLSLSLSLFLSYELVVLSFGGWGEGSQCWKSEGERMGISSWNTNHIMCTSPPHSAKHAWESCLQEKEREKEWKREPSEKKARPQERRRKDLILEKEKSRRERREWGMHHISCNISDTLKRE